MKNDNISAIYVSQKDGCIMYDEPENKKCPHHHVEWYERKAYTHLLVPKNERRWWHKWFPPKTNQAFCAKCGEALRALDRRYYT